MIRSMERDDFWPHNLAAGDPALAEALISRYYTAIYRLAQSILYDPDDADDAAQETFLRALRAWNSFQPGGNLKAWLSTIAIRLCRDRLRRRQARQRMEGVLQALHLASPPPPSPEESLLAQEGSQALWAAVQALDEKHRLPVILRFVQGMSAPEIALALEVPEGTVHSRLHNAVHKLHDRLDLALLDG